MCRYVCFWPEINEALAYGALFVFEVSLFFQFNFDLISSALFHHPSNLDPGPYPFASTDFLAKIRDRCGKL